MIIVPQTLVQRVQPDRRGEVFPDGLQPLLPGLLVFLVVIEIVGVIVTVVGKAHARAFEFIRRHGSIAHDDHLVLRLQVVQKPLRRDPVLAETGRLFIDGIVDAVVEVIDLQILEMTGTVDRLEQPVAELRVAPHGAAAVHKQQKLRLVLPGPLHHDLQHARIAAGLVNCLVDIQLGLQPVVAVGKKTQLFQSHLVLTDGQRTVVAEIPEPALSRHHQGAAVHAVAQNADPVGRVAAVAEGRLSSGADPLLSAVVLLLLLPEPLLHDLPDLLQCLVLPHGIDLRLVEVRGRHGFGEPLVQLLRQLVRRLDAFEVLDEGLVEAVVVLDLLHQNGAGHVIELCEACMVQVHVQRLQQHVPLIQAGLHAVIPQNVKKVCKHSDPPDQ